MTDQLDKIRSNTLNQIEKTEKNFKFAVVGAAVLELAFFAGFLLLADLSNRNHLLLLLAAIAIYTILALGLVALGIHNNRNALRIIRAVETIKNG